MKTKVIFLFLSIFSASILNAQQIKLKGQVSIHNSKYNTGTIQYVANAHASAPYTSPDNSDINGIFNLEFVGMDGGTSVKIAIEKDGFEVVNGRDLEDVIIGRKNKIYIFLSTKGQLAKAQTELYNISKKTLYAEYDRKIEILESDGLEKEKIIADLNASLNLEILGKNEAIYELKKQLQEVEKKLPESAQELAYINLDFSSELYIKAYELYIGGKINESIAILDNAKLEQVANDALIAIEVGEEITEKGKLQVQQVIEHYQLHAFLYQQKIQYKLALEIHKKIVALQEKVLDKNDSKLSISYNNMALVYQDLGEYTRARDLLKLALQSDTKNFGDDHPFTARKRSNLATVYRDLGEYTQARDLLKLALQSDIKNFEDDHLSTAIRRSNLALVYQDLGEYTRARDLLKLALQSNIKNFGNDHPSTAMSRSNLALVHKDLGEYTQAQDLLKLVLQSDTKNFGDDHPSTARSRSNLAMVYQDLKEYTQAQDLLKLALQSDINNFGDDHPSTVRSRSNLAMVYHDLGKYTQAQDLLKLTLQSAIKNFGDDHPFTAIRRSNLATVYQTLGKYTQARDLLKLALQSDIKNFGDDHPSTARSRSNLALAYQALGEYTQARDLLKLALQSDGKNFGDDHPSTVIRRSNLATVYNEYGMKLCNSSHFKQAKNLFLQSLILRMEINDTSNFIIPLNNIGSTFKDLGKCDSALIYLNKGLSYAKEIQSNFLKNIETAPDSIRTHPNFPIYVRNNSQEALLERLYFHKADCLHRLGKKEDAAQIFERLKQVAIKRDDQRFLKEIEETGY